jgi:hypothetical protein
MPTEDVQGSWVYLHLLLGLLAGIRHQPRTLLLLLLLLLLLSFLLQSSPHHQRCCQILCCCCCLCATCILCSW